MTEKTYLNLNEIKVSDRMRGELGDLDGLADSIRRIGQLQPGLVDKDNNLIAGERRYRSLQRLGAQTMWVVRQDQVDEVTKKEMEFEENFFRKAMTWQEECLGILEIFYRRKRQGVLEGFSGSYYHVIAEMFRISVGQVNYVLCVAKELKKELTLPDDKRIFWNYGSATEAYQKGILGAKIDELNAELARRAQSQAQVVPVVTSAQVSAQAAKELGAKIEVLAVNPDAREQAKARYDSNPLNVVPFDEYLLEKEKNIREADLTIHLSSSVIHGDSIDFMNENEGRFDHIITDIPYGIDMDTLNQSNTHGGLQDLDKLEAEHDVAENMSLMAKFFPAAFRCTKDQAFVITCMDIMQWQYMYDLAIKAGFRVQRWPYIWRKVNQSVMNNCAQYNTTKDFEPVMICRKPSAVLADKRNTSFTDAGNSKATKETGHPFAKPYELTTDLCNMVSHKTDSILDPFAGAGSMAIEMLRQERRVVAVEKNERWFNKLQENVKTLYYLSINSKFIFK